MRSALSFLTIAGGSRPPGPSTLDWFPAVGLVVGGVLGVVWWAAGRAWPAGPAAAVVIIVDLALTGLLHLDGLADSADGLLAPMARERRLSVMAAPDTGAFGVGACFSVLLLRWSALSVLGHGDLWRDVAALAGLWCLSRTLMASVARWRPYARPSGGLASAFSGPRHPVVTVSGIIGAAALLVAWHPLAGTATVAAATAAGFLVVLLADRRIGGYTGDVLGAGVLITETAGLLAAAARW